jgi:hypothetical protein
MMTPKKRRTSAERAVNKVLLATVLLLALLQGACRSQVQYAAGRYANCVDLGELSLQARSRTDAEERMRAQVAEMGGDTLLMSESGRTDQLTETPQEIVERRDVVMGTPTVSFEQASSPDGDRPLPVLPAAPTDTELWYYGAALRCNAS